MSPGSVPVRLGNALWRLRFPLVYGTATFTVSRRLSVKATTCLSAQAGSNMLKYMEGLTPALAERLDNAQLTQFAQFFTSSFQTLIWRDSLPGAPLFEVARKDYEASTADLLCRRYGQARWGAQQATEKTFKALLNHRGTAFPTGGPHGHNLAHLSQLLSTNLGVVFDASLIDAAGCSPSVRYNEEPSNERQALAANHAVLGLLATLRDSSDVAGALGRPV